MGKVSIECIYTRAKSKPWNMADQHRSRRAARQHIQRLPWALGVLFLLECRGTVEWVYVQTLLAPGPDREDIGQKNFMVMHPSSLSPSLCFSLSLSQSA
jgi:hypothetical protein